MVRSDSPESNLVSERGRAGRRDRPGERDPRVPRNSPQTRGRRWRHVGGRRGRSDRSRPRRGVPCVGGVLIHRPHLELVLVPIRQPARRVSRSADEVAGDAGPASRSDTPVSDLVVGHGRAGRRGRPVERDLAVPHDDDAQTRGRRRHHMGRPRHRPDRSRPRRGVASVPSVSGASSAGGVLVRRPYLELVLVPIVEARHRVARPGDEMAPDEEPASAPGAVLDVVTGRRCAAHRGGPGQRHLSVARGGPKARRNRRRHMDRRRGRRRHGRRPSSPRRARRSSSGAGSRPAPGTGRVGCRFAARTRNW
jgi:hypothetical protein